MTKLENNINNLCVENMGIYGCKHAVKEHVWTGKAHMIAKLKKNVKSMREEPFAYACMFFSVDTLVSCSQLLGYRITEHAEMYGSVICSTRKGMLTRLSATELTAFML